jgi:hypothetical protein
VSLRRRELGKNLPPVKQVSITEAQDKVVSLSGSGVIVSWASTLKRPVKSVVSHHRLLISSKGLSKNLRLSTKKVQIFAVIQDKR